MKKKFLCTALSVAMVASLVAGCGNSGSTEAPTTTENKSDEPTSEAPKDDTSAGEIPQDYKYYFSFDEADDRVHSAKQDTAATPIVQITDDEVNLVNGVKGNAAYVNGVNGLKLDVNGVGDAYTVSFWMYATRFANYMPSLQYGPDMHGDVTGGQHYVNFTRAEWNPDGAAFPCVWAYDQNADGSPWPNWYPDEVGEHLKEWVNITMTVDAADTDDATGLIPAHLYMNGEELIGYDSDKNVRPVYIVQNSMEPSDNFDFLLGINYWDAVFKGAFDEVYVYDYVLDASQAKALYEAGDPTQTFEEPERVVTVTPDENAIDTVGQTDFSNGWWSDFSAPVEIKDGETKVVELHNWSDGINSWDNYVLVFTNEETEAHQNPNADGAGTDKHKEYAVLRADCYGWMGDKNPDTNPELFNFEYSWGNWATWAQQVMMDAAVTLEINRDGDTITVNSTMVDYNGTANTSKSVLTTELTKDDPCYFLITCEECYIDILSVDDKLEITANPDAVEAIGNTDLLVPFWSDWTSSYEIADGATKTFKLHNYSDGANNWDNFVVALINGETKAHEAPADQVDGYREWSVTRADAFGWVDDATQEFTTSWDDWAAWEKMMKNADVTLKATRTGNVVDYDITFTAADGTEYSEQVKITTAMADGDPCYLFFTNEASYVELLSVE